MPNYLSWAAVLARYAEFDKLPNVSSTSVQDAMMDMAEAELNSRLASRYTAPFSSNNMTAISIGVDVLYVQNQLTRQPEKAKALMGSVDSRIAALLDGSASMIDSTGTVLDVSGTVVWSSSENYPPTFGMSPIEESVVSSAQIYDERSLRGEV